MPRIIVRCPTTGQNVPTGQRTLDVDLAAADEPRAFRCPVCQQVHSWRGIDAWSEASAAGVAPQTPPVAP